MGVQGLWRLLESTGKPINPETLEGKVLAVDISIWLNQAVKGVRDREGNSVHNAHLLTLFHRICKLLFFRIRPVFVFDGDAPLLKKQTLTLRRQRKEELSRESKQTNEKLLKTFLKRQAIKAALGDHSKDPLPSLSNVRRDEVDDMYVLPALPPAEEKEKSSSEEEEEESEEMSDSYHMYQGEMYEDPNSMDINSEEFASLPPEMKHEILKDMKEFSKRRRTMFHKPPECSGDFSQYQLAGLLQRNRLNQRLVSVEKEMNQRTAGGAPQLYEQDGDQQSHNIESHRLVSEDNSHYILIKGSKKSEKAPESQPAVAPWSGSSLSGSRRRGADKPKPLWRPVCEEEEDMLGSSSDESKPSVSKPSISTQEETSPPSPRTLTAIQAAMNDSSDEEKVDQKEKDGGVSPRTLLAIQKALEEEEEHAAERRTLIISSPTKPQVDICHPVQQVVISSSEEETEPDVLPNANSLSNIKSYFKENPIDQSLHVKDNLLVSSSEDEMEEVIGERNKALHSVVSHQPHRGSDGPKELERQKEVQMTSGEEARKEKLIEKLDKPFKKTETDPLIPAQRGNMSIVLQEQRADDVKSESREESESEESFIEVSEEEPQEEDADEVSDDEIKQEEKTEESLTEAPSGVTAASNSEEEEDSEGQDEDEEELKEEAEAETSLAPVINEFEHVDLAELEALESSLQVEQSNLREQKQQQERMANTVTGQMYLESQELLRLFGVPFLVAPMEAEAQCAALDRADQTNGTITDDSDVWLFGGRHVFKNFFSQNKYVTHFQLSDLQNHLGLDRSKLINLAYLLGSDYTEGVPGVGYVTGMEILNEFPGLGLEPLREFSQWWLEAQEKKRLVANPRDTKVKKKLRDLKLQPGFPNPAVAQAYLQPAVDQSEGSFSWGRPQLDMLKEYCQSRFGWSSRRTEETLQPVMKQLNTQQTQQRIDSFFRMEQQEKQAIRSQRLRRAVTCMKRKEREEEEEDIEEEKEMASPSKSKKGKSAGQSQRKGIKGGQREEERPVAGGGFLGSEVVAETPLTPVKDVSSFNQEAPSVKAAVPQSTKAVPQREMQRGDAEATKAVPQGEMQGSSSSSGEDSDDTGVVAMVTARSVFEGSRRGRGAKGTRGRGRGRGKGKKP
ncbi:DNA excision repair protein ERCC-5 [Scomber japonicus]|uniref:DNA excision repair protein ERCC-5 n=1 Tax=Scomber japonicus TaxID=13676 RepID=UPI002305D854|nr:DNA excision repair protein ERCC-5 [Scomber japonicus]